MHASIRVMFFYIQADPELVPSSADGSRLCPSFCPVSSDLIAFVRKKDLWVVSMKSGHEYQLTNEHNGTLQLCML
jgi:hypothetical protein